MKRAVEQVLSARLGGGAWSVLPQGGSGFCSTWQARPGSRATSRAVLFVKSAPATQASMLQAEADGLAALSAAACIRSPHVTGCWIDTSLDVVVLALEWLDLTPHAPRGFGERLGRDLAALHRSCAPEGGGRFGWRRDNWLGGTPQRNRWSAPGGLEGWLAFFAQERLGAMAEQLAAAATAPALIDAVGRIIDTLPRLFDDGHVPRPSLIHGDLWSGNWGCLADGTPVIYDPAVSISDAEAELAMMELFGNPPVGFWPAYREVTPIADGYFRRRSLYQLYHLLNHALLFGGGYAGQAMHVIDSLLAAR